MRPSPVVHGGPCPKASRRSQRQTVMQHAVRLRRAPHPMPPKHSQSSRSHVALPHAPPAVATDQTLDSQRIQRGDVRAYALPVLTNESRLFSMGEQAAAHFNFARNVIERWAQLRSHDLALWCVDEAGAERRFNFSELADRTRRASAIFHQAGIRRGDCVLVMLPRVPMWWIGMLGLIRIGAVPIPA